MSGWESTITAVKIKLHIINDTLTTHHMTVCTSRNKHTTNRRKIQTASLI